MLTVSPGEAKPAAAGVSARPKLKEPAGASGAARPLLAAGVAEVAAAP
jgi:hypothetical protein